MNSALIVDTNTLIFLFDGSRDIAKSLLDAERVLVPAIVCGEMDAGSMGDSKREVATRAAFEKFLTLPKVAVYPVTRRTGHFFAKVYTYCKSVGKPIPADDVWIAAMALETGATVLTNDRHLLDLPLISVQKVGK